MYKSSNNAYATLALAMNNTTDTLLQVASGKGALFPVIVSPNHTYVTLENAGGSIETVKVTARASGSDSMTVVRAQDGTVIRSWLIGDIVECRPCAAAIADLQAEFAAADAAHVAATDPHTQYTNATELAAAIAAAGYQPLDNELSALALMNPTRVAEIAALSAFIGSLLNDADAATAQATLGIASTKRAFTAQQTPIAGALTDGATIDWNGDSNGQIVTLTLGGNRTMNAPTNIVQNTSYLLRVAQDATGSRLLTWNAAFKFGISGAPTLSTGAGKVDFISFVGGASNTLECLGVRKDSV